MKRFPVLVSLVLATAACSNNDTASNTPTLASVRSAIVAGNFAEAALSAEKLAASSPKDPAVQFELARAEALHGNQGRAMDALEASINGGLGNASQSLTDPAFDTVRGTDKFAALTNRASPSASKGGEGGDAVAAGSGADSVKIQQGANGTHIQAGNVRLDTKD